MNRRKACSAEPPTVYARVQPVIAHSFALESPTLAFARSRIVLPITRTEATPPAESRTDRSANP
jgi:hypothetical protein